MDIKEVFKYFAATDVLQNRSRRNAEIISQAGGSKTALPTELSFKAASQIYFETAKTAFLIYPLTLAFRLSGLDLATKVVSALINKED
jgi:hypothetical protein